MNHSTTTTCPGFDDLSAWHDGELADPTIDAHLATCQDCQNILRDFEAFDVELEQHLAEVTPSQDVVDRMLKRTRRRVGKGGIKLFSLPVFTRLAACAALVLICAYLVRANRHVDARLANRLRPVNDSVVANIDDGQSDDLSAFEQKLIQDLLAEFGDHSTPAPTATRPDATFADVTLPSTADAADALASRDADVGSNGVLHLSNISLVGYGTPGNYRDELRASNPVASRHPALVKDRVRHVWLVDDARSPLQQLQKLMPNHKQDFKELIDQNRDEYVLQFVITDKDLQGLVDHFDGLGFKLMSPQEPQPGHGRDLRLNGKTIQYEVDFVQK